MALLLAACGSDDSSSGGDATGDTATEAVESFQTSTGITCSREEPSSKGNGKTYDAPSELTLEEGVTYTATLATSCGDIVVELDAVDAPITTNNFVFLARDGFYDGLTFHRAVPDFVIQGGDPAGDGTGGPGYQFEDELPTDGYPQGSFAMANAGPSTNGSQFFIVTGQADLANDFSRFGRVIQGLEVAQGIESLGDASQQPSETVYITSVAITES
jgi:cyclophilin family peptidyl-prolyl cis-trans isomerase